MNLITKWIKAYRELRSFTKPNNFAKIFEVPNGQVLIEMDYPQFPDEPYGLIQKTVIEKTIKGKITTDYPTEASMRNAFMTFDLAKAKRFNEDIHKIV